ncbi:arginine--tRNA ligase [Phorcysia thermohydrogeniphila]|uniref:Arginine--tRNA ligase n=1 Tax=Phorcysia thermohydrogeniphila TaxID=936138 RepID=A0A4R1GHU1_9BACT|nr:arginine--tRNA ligase [Phorcysia thermohydrogeniphila]TCK06600.1 arginyl-tRNA synthetase [Phorcysia thermohydrogeniphila]
MKEFVREKVTEAIKEVYGEDKVSVVERASFEKPKKKEFGDFATNVSFLLARELREKPFVIAQELSEKLSQLSEFEKVEVAGGGFINFTFSQNFYVKLLREVAETDFYVSDIGKGKKILLEYVSANPTGPLHVGHGRGAVVGDVLYRIMKLTGYSPEREFYINDAGRQIKLLGLSIYARMKELKGEDYPFPEDGYKGEYIKELAEKLLKERPDILELPEEEAVEVASEFGKEELLKEIKEDLKELGVEFDSWFSEKGLYERGEVERVLKLLDEKGLLYEKDGALWLKTTLFGDDKDRVVRRSNGEYTYFASDIAYHYNKIERGYDKAIDVWGADHHGYIPRVKAAIEALGKDPDWLEVVLIQLVKLFKGGQEVKMSKRAGNFVTLRWLMDEVGVDAVRFFFLLKRHDTPLDFDIDLALSAKNENPVYYVQYAHARLCSIIDKAKERGLEPRDEHLNLLSSEEEKELITGCYMLRYELQAAAERREPHRLTYYLIDLASKLHRFYNKHRVVDEEKKELTSARLYLIEAVRKTIKTGLDILNINAPRRM